MKHTEDALTRNAHATAQPQPPPRSTHHSGDVEHAKDDVGEVAIITTNLLSPLISKIYVCATCYSHHGISRWMDTASIRLLDVSGDGESPDRAHEKPGDEVCFFEVPGLGTKDHNTGAIILGRLIQTADDGRWVFEALGERKNAHTSHQLRPFVDELASPARESEGHKLQRSTGGRNRRRRGTISTPPEPGAKPPKPAPVEEAVAEEEEEEEAKPPAPEVSMDELRAELKAELRAEIEEDLRVALIEDVNMALVSRMEELTVDLQTRIDARLTEQAAAFETHQKESQDRIEALERRVTALEEENVHLRNRVVAAEKSSAHAHAVAAGGPSEEHHHHHTHYNITVEDMEDRLLVLLDRRLEDIERGIEDRIERERRSLERTGFGSGGGGTSGGSGGGGGGGGGGVSPGRSSRRHRSSHRSSGKRSSRRRRDPYDEALHHEPRGHRKGDPTDVERSFGSPRRLARLSTPRVTTRRTDDGILEGGNIHDRPWDAGF